MLFSVLPGPTCTRDDRRPTMAATKPPVAYQTPKQAAGGLLDRKDHIWIDRTDGKGYKCVLCGAVSLVTPPRYPTAPDWLPDHYEGLTNQERIMSVGHTTF
jgi:hypothetical protein